MDSAQIAPVNEDIPQFEAVIGEDNAEGGQKKKKKKKKKKAADTNPDVQDTDDFIRQAQEVEEQERKLREIEEKQQEL